jgi:predicted PolB exonuclease-like 3'-5' exonuclease
MNDNVIIWDIETIPGLQGFAAANYLTGKTDAEIREVMGDKFPKHIYHSVVCIGALVAHQQNGGSWVIDAFGAPSISERSEKELISSFVDRIAELTPQLVTFNGSSFEAKRASSSSSDYAATRNHISAMRSNMVSSFTNVYAWTFRYSTVNERMSRVHCQHDCHIRNLESDNRPCPFGGHPRPRP